MDYGDGSPVQTLAISDGSFSLSHRYTAAGAHTVTVTVTDDDVSSMRMATIVVQTPVEAVDDALAMVTLLQSGGSLATSAASRAIAGAAVSLSGGADVNWRSVISMLEAAKASLERGNRSAASGQLGAVRSDLEAIVGSGRLTTAEVQPLDSLVYRVIRSIT